MAEKKKITIAKGKLVGEKGPGSLYVDTEGISYLISAVDKWYENTKSNVDIEELKIRDSRVERMLNVDHFRQVPAYIEHNFSEESRNTEMMIPIQRFPLVHYCSECMTIGTFQTASDQKKKRCKSCDKATSFIQFPIVVVCEEGHIEDFPYDKYVHVNKECDNSIKHEVKIQKLGSSILHSKLVCSCGASHSLSGVTGKGDGSKTPFQKEMKGYRCFGNKPWAGTGKKEGDCDANPTAILRNALNVYRPDVFSVLSISEHSNSKSNSYEDILLDEFNKLAIYETEKNNKLTVSYSFEGTEKSIIKQVNFVRKLEELVIQTGFHRLSPSDENIAMSKALDSKSNIMFSDESKDYNWLPAKQLFGEGIFIEFNREVLENWQEKTEVKEHFEKAQNKTAENYLSEKFRTPISVLIHTLSHGLMKELSKNAGYSNTALKEKLYVKDGKYGLLIYVTDSDKEGTFGGLVSLANEDKFKNIFNKSLRSMDWCSSDPVCYETGLNQGQGLYNSNGAACHNCTYVPNTSCSFSNCYLDRDYVFRIDSNVIISKDFGWFENLDTIEVANKIEVVDKGVEFPYSNWKEASGFESSDFYIRNDIEIAEFTEAVISINDTKFNAKYFWPTEKRITLYNQEEQENELKDAYFGKNGEWEILKEN
ncbi:hypothetical protein QP816_10935 [Staphylococcus condimenti]|uniref:Zn-binding domain-containing protein n=1 Tax=Staphylococcus condimenti TaxID=70255 RepID=UPI00254C4A37|nr:Zn-binding domain-containing protein [Staphylococcus condimenti]MDK8646098.1 hypothetical protein [Staphylococcus condimenti]